MSDKVIINKLKEDLERINRNIELYQEKLGKYPQGYLREKKVNDKSYYYLRKRKDDKIMEKYIRLDDVNEVQESISKRDFIYSNLKKLISQKKYLEKILKKELKYDK